MNDKGNNEETLPQPEEKPQEEEEILSEDDNINPKYSKGNTSFLGAFLQIGNTILGAGIISLPVVFRYLGFVLGFVFIAIISILTIYSSYLLLKAHQITSKNKYLTIAHASMGDKGYIFTNMMIILNNFGLSCVYFRVVADTLQNIIGGYVSKDNFFVTNWHNFIFILFILIIMSFVIWTQDFKKFEKTSFLGMAGIIIYFIVLIILFFYKISKGFKPYHSLSSYFISGKFTDILISLPSVFLSFSFQFNLFPIYSGLINRTHKEMLNVTKSSIIFCFVLYIFSGIIGFLIYGDSLNDTILNAFLIEIQEEQNDDTVRVLLIIANIGFLVCATTSIPLVYYSLKENFFSTYKFILKHQLKKKIKLQNEEENNKIRNTTNTLEEENNIEEKEEKDDDNTINSDNNENNENNNDNNETIDQEAIRTDTFRSIDFKDENVKKVKVNITKNEEIIISILLYLIIGCVTILIPKLKSMFNIVGCTAANCIQFIIPCLMVLCLKKKAEKLINLLFAKILLCFGIFSLIICLIAEIVHNFIYDDN